VEVDVTTTEADVIVMAQEILTQTSKEGVAAAAAAASAVVAEVASAVVVAEVVLALVVAAVDVAVSEEAMPLELEVLEPVLPSEAEAKDAEAYAARVRQIMADALAVSLVDKGVEELHAFENSH